MAKAPSSAWKKKHSERPVIRGSRTTKREVSGWVRVVRASGMRSPSGYIYPDKKLLPGRVLDDGRLGHQEQFVQRA